MRKCKLKDLIEVSRGATLPGRFYSTEGDLIRLTLGNFDYNNGGFKQNTSKEDIYYTGDVRPEFILNEGDIITPLTEQAVGLLGTTAKIPESGKFIQSQDVALVKCLEGLYPGYCYYLLPSNTVKKQLSVGAQQTSIRHTSPDKIKDCWVYILEKNEQKKVADFLDMFERKIAINRRINERLERMAKLLYDYWFVQFEFPNDEGKPYKSSGGKMVWNEKLKREIPEGWEVKKIGDTITYSRGVSYNGNNLGIVEDLSIPMINLASFTPSGVYNPNGIKYYVGNINEEKLLSPLDLVMCNTQQTAIDFKKDIIGRVLLVPSFFKNKVIASHHVTIIRCNRPNLKYYYYSLFSTDCFHRYIAKHTNGTNILSLNFQGVEDFICPIPTIQLLNKYASFICNFEKQKFNHIYENDRLTALRDFLLPMLMNGQVEIKEK